MNYIILSLLIIVFVAFIYILRNGCKKKNKGHNLFDDFLIYSTTLPIFFWLIWICMFPSDHTVKEIVNNPFLYILVGWSVVGCIWFLLRYYKKR